MEEQIEKEPQADSGELPQEEDMEKSGGRGRFTKKEKDLDMDKVVVHTMPKRFLTVPETVRNVKSAGILIILGGIIILFTLLFGIYFFFFKDGGKNIFEVKKDVIIEREEADNSFNISEESKEEPRKETLSTDSSGPSRGGEEIIKEKTADEEAKTEEKEEKVVIDTDKTATTSEEELISVPPQKAPDKDLDNLGDREELVFGTNADLYDSDLDGYDDLTEVLGLYNPAGIGQIMVNEKIERYTNANFNYFMYYPKSWIINSIDNGSSIIFNTQDGQFIQMVVADMSPYRTLDEWYKSQFNVSAIKASQRLSKKGWTTVRTEDKLTIYLSDGKTGKIFTLSYNLGSDKTLYYENIFIMMFNSLEMES